MNNSELDDIIIGPENYTQTLIWLPGWGRYPSQDARVFESIRFLPNTRIRILMAPLRKVNRSGKEVIQTSWTFSFHPPLFSTSLPSLIEISRYIDDILVDEYSKCPNVYLGGFSQGGIVSLYTGLVTSDVPLKGVIAFSCRPLFRPPKASRCKIPIYVYLGELDEILPFDSTYRGHLSVFKKLNVSIRREKGLGHQYSYKEFKDLSNWINGPKL